MNAQLLALYQANWNELVKVCNDIPEQNVAHPLLIKVDKHYEDAKYKVMVVGQETDGWIGNFSKKPKEIQFIMNDYYAYLYNQPEIMCPLHYKKYTPLERLKKKNRRPFWNKANFAYFKTHLGKTLGEDNVAFVWNNLSKLGKTTRGKATNSIEQIEDAVFKGLHLQELAILKPDIIIFTSGNGRDHLIKRRYNVNFSKLPNFKQADISKVEFETPHKQIVSFRTYHPNARVHVKTRKTRNRAIIDNICNE